MAEREREGAAAAGQGANALDGVLAVWKPAGWTSHDVVAKVRRLIRVKRIGHAGTLDPQVTGVLPLCIGRATRVVEYLQELPKAYEARLQLGVATDTEDLTGTVVERVEDVRVSEADVRAALARFVGEIEQVPPMYSAVRVDGKRLYELARAGKTVERKPRKVVVYDIELRAAELDSRSPSFEFAVTCSKGTYIRTLCVDIGRALGVPAAMAGLKRTVSAGLAAADCVTLEQLEELQRSGGLAERLIPADRALAHMPAAVAAGAAARQARQGVKLPATAVEVDPGAAGIVRLYDDGGRFIGLFERDGDAELLRPVKVFA